MTALWKRSNRHGKYFR